MVNGIVSLISLSDLSLSVYRNARDFCALIFIYLFIWLLWGLHCFAWGFSSCGERGLLFAAVHGLIVVASLVAEHGLKARGLH